jgi:hypothetical protein
MDESPIGNGAPATSPPGEDRRRMSNKVVVHRWPDSYSLMGSPTLVLDLEEACDQLAQNPWMKNWLAARVREALLAGECFTHEKRIDEGWRGRPDGVVGEYRMATEEEILNYVDTTQFANVTGHAATKRAQENRYDLHYHEGAALIRAYENLPRQARVVLDLLAATGRDSFTEASIEVVLTEGEEQLKTKQKPLQIWNFYRKRLVEEGHVSEGE